MISQHVRERLLPLVTFEEPSVATHYGQAAWDAGLRVIEVGFRTAGAAEAIANFRSHTKLHVVAGTLTSQKDVDQAIEAGAHSGIAPHLDPHLLDYARNKGFFVVPGIASPSELGEAIRLGFTEVKVYPMVPLGGVVFLAALRAIFPAVGFIPSGGIRLQDLTQFLDAPGVVAVSGSWLPSISSESPLDTEVLSQAVTALLATVA